MSFFGGSAKKTYIGEKQKEIEIPKKKFILENDLNY
jgi:hypothetical protein